MDCYVRKLSRILTVVDPNNEAKNSLLFENNLVIWTEISHIDQQLKKRNFVITQATIAS